MIDEETLAQINGDSLWSMDAELLCHDVYEFGMNWWLIDSALRMTPEQRLEHHQRRLNLILAIEVTE